MYELAAAPIDESTLQKYERWRVTLSKINRLINPTARDWWETVKVIRRLYLMKFAPHNKLKTLWTDALIARLATMRDGFIVMHDVDDFLLIQRAVPKLAMIAADEFFN